MTSATRAAVAGNLRWIDQLGIVLSALCAVHCAVTPLLLMVFPFASGEGAESVFRTGVLGLGIFGVGLGAVLHRNTRAFLPLGAAVVLAVVLEVSGVLGVAELLLSLGISVGLITAHVLNTRACANTPGHHCIQSHPAHSGHSHRYHSHGDHSRVGHAHVGHAHVSHAQGAHGSSAHSYSDHSHGDDALREHSHGDHSHRH